VIKITIDKYINKIVEDAGLTRKEIQNLVKEKKEELNNLISDKDSNSLTELGKKSRN